MKQRLISIAVARGTYDEDSGEGGGSQSDVEVRYVDATDLAALSALEGCSALIVGLHQLREPQLRALPQSVQVIGRAGIGLDSIDLQVADELGISVVHQPSYATAEVAEHAVALMVGLVRQVALGDRLARSAWPSWDRYSDVPSLGECTLGLVGMGRIGAAVAKRIQPLVKRVVAFEPAVVDAPPGVELLPDLATLLGASDIVSLHAPMTSETAKMINATTIDQMRPGSFLVNVSRGGLVDEDALAAALGSGHLRGAALDVLSVEPPVPDNPMLTAPNTILSPHAAWLSRSSQSRLREWTMNDVVRVVSGYRPDDGRLAVLGHRSGALQEPKE